MVQEIIAFAILAIAIAFLIRKFFWKPKNKKNCGDNDCGCH
ncbi:FeoB-associated Cys-rich membrane protein [Flavobacterium branchiarum]|jgi:large-conductance mechanosensitive channel|uniref:FeoB-associated Cys-rich membrane protein n=1 Tax=Flavobacterium branchiarum TaxID=1114870 RepID=A0ABV5FPE3_9FLAO|nr:FeoB-associated Cys-rich membrane protein [Flavobacterium branchiarum]MDN3675492.1 FeoB-associated Cys-rich membrane protein [Flavobacterium branchiarum]